MGVEVGHHRRAESFHGDAAILAPRAPQHRVELGPQGQRHALHDAVAIRWRQDHQRLRQTQALEAQGYRLREQAILSLRL